MVLVWRITDDSPNSPNFPPAKHSHYMVINSTITLLQNKYAWEAPLKSKKPMKFILVNL